MPTDSTYGAIAATFWMTCPDSARVDLYVTALRNADPMLCEMMADQLGNFWTSYGAYGVGLLADASRRPWRSRTNERSNFSTSIGNLCRHDSDE